MKKAFSTVLVLVWSVLLSNAALSSREAARIADAIFVVEGGSKAKVPYGILSVKVKDKAHARKICINTIQNTHDRWIQNGRPGDFLHFLGNRYCPPADAVGNKNWKKNIKLVLNKATGRVSS